MIWDREDPTLGICEDRSGCPPGGSRACGASLVVFLDVSGCLWSCFNRNLRGKDFSSRKSDDFVKRISQNLPKSDQNPKDFPYGSLSKNNRKFTQNSPKSGFWGPARNLRNGFWVVSGHVCHARNAFKHVYEKVIGSDFFCRPPFFRGRLQKNTKFSKFRDFR